MSANTFPQSAMRSTTYFGSFALERLQCFAQAATNGEASGLNGTSPIIVGHEFDDFDWQRDSPQETEADSDEQDGWDMGTTVYSSSDGGSNHVDTDNDSVYHINAAPGSYSRTFVEDDNDELPLCVAEMLHTIALREHPGQPTALPLGGWCCQPLRSDSSDSDKDEDEEHHEQKYDTVLRGVMREIKQRLMNNVPLVLEFCAREGSFCGLPGWRSTKHRIAAGCYYVTLGHTEGVSRYDVAFCLGCLEYIWAGKDMMGEHPSPMVADIEAQAVPEEAERPTSGIPIIDGAADEEVDTALAKVLTAVGFNWAGSEYNGYAREEYEEGYEEQYEEHCKEEERNYSLRDELLKAATKCGDPNGTFAAETSPISMTSKSSRENDAVINSPTSGFFGTRKAAWRKTKIHPNSLHAPLETASLQSLKTSVGDQKLHFAPQQSAIAEQASSEPTTSTTSREPRRSNRKNLPPEIAIPIATKQCDRIASDAPPKALKKVIAADKKHIAATAKSEAKRSVMTAKRDNLLKDMRPGDRVPVHSLRGSKKKTVMTAFKPHVSKDMFGIDYTDLLQEPPAPGFHQHPLQDHLLVSKTPSTLSAQIKTHTSDHKHSALAVPKPEPSSCSCYQPDKGDMMECSNYKCLRGWYHVRCVKSENPKQEGWLCWLCKPRPALAPKPSASMQALADDIFKPHYAGKSMYGINKPMQDWFKPAASIGVHSSPTPMQKKYESPCNAPLGSSTYLPSRWLKVLSAGGKKAASRQKSTTPAAEEEEQDKSTPKAAVIVNGKKASDAPYGVSVITNNTQSRALSPQVDSSNGGSARDSVHGTQAGDDSSPDKDLPAATDLASENGLVSVNDPSPAMQLDGTCDSPPPQDKSWNTYVGEKHLQLDGPRDYNRRDTEPPTVNAHHSKLSAAAAPFVPSSRPPHAGLQYATIYTSDFIYQPTSTPYTYANVNGPSNNTNKHFNISSYHFTTHQAAPTEIHASTPRYVPTASSNSPSRLSQRIHQPNTRVQCLAPFIKPGQSLNTQDKAVLALWQLQTRAGWTVMQGEEAFLVEKAGLKGMSKTRWEGLELGEMLEVGRAVGGR